MDKKAEFLLQLQSLIEESTPFKLILSKPRKGHNIKNQTFTCLDNDSEKYKSLEKTDTQHFTKMILKNDLSNVVTLSLNESFLFAELSSQKYNLQLLQSEKGRATLIKKGGTNIEKPAAHNKQKSYAIPEEAAFLQLLGISSSNGKVFDKAQKKYRQINKFIEIIDGLIPTTDDELTIADMGSGKAYLTFATYYYLTEIKGRNITMIGYELRQDLVDLCNGFSSKLGYANLAFIQANIIEAEIKKADVIISLHACDIATDMAIFAGFKSKAKVMILAPCCHKQIRKQITKRNAILNHPILLERQAELLTDAMRALIMESQGYKTKVFEFISSEHTSKNLMIVAEKDKVNGTALRELEEIKATYGIEYHYLEKLIEV
jgi:hypothetical protein